MEKGSESRGQARWSIPFLFLLSLFCLALSEQIHYAVPEELAKGSLVGNLAKDLGVSLEDLPTRNLRVSAEKKFFAVSTENGDLLVSDRIDREQICGKKSTCVLEFEVMAEKPLNFFHVTVLIQDINDNPPTFNQNITELEISELALTGTTFALEPAQDLDVGVNSLQQYHLSPHPRFSLIQKENPDGSRYPELVLKAPLDREEQSTHHLVLTALDGGEPSRSCTTQIRIIVADANDNPPVFTQDTYRVSVSENLPPGSSVLTLIATDPDEGVNAEVTYAFITTEKSVTQLFKLDSYTGELTTGEGLDFEERASYTIGVEAKDSGHHTAYCKIQIDVLDENDNAPEITLASESQHIQEDALPGTVVALIKIYDLDSGVNGEILCQLKGKFPFKIIQDTKNTYRLVTDGALDREQFPDYNLTVTASDRGSPPLSSSRTITLHIADVNDNAPVFQQASYLVHVPENNPPGASLAQVSAFDPDVGPNGHVSYSIGLSYHVLQASDPGLFSLGLRTGEVRTARALGDRDTARQRLLVAVRDGGRPPLSATATLHLVFADSLQEVLPDLGDSPAPSDPQAELQFYLVVALALISVLFLLAVILAVALRLRSSSSPASWGCFQPGLSSIPGVLPNYCEGTLPYSYNSYAIPHSSKTEFKFLTIKHESVPPQDLCDESSWLESNSHNPERTPNSAETQQVSFF
ncbi:protocadherin gamma-B3 [Tupaia chinensis]|uniref:protocadherin gamma-B3 n=1 Tax=Tupaia chinensis TaxID=246437 RepID=UPI0003C919DE|nr:protocadherin gamma-B3 [Tupaia chinensis]